MRKITVYLLCLLLSGCGRISLPEIPPYKTEGEESTLWQPIVFADTSDCCFLVEQFEINQEGNYTCKVVCGNRSDTAQLFSCESWCVDGWQVLSFWGEEVQPGTEATFLVTLPPPKTEAYAAGRPTNIAFDLRIFSQADLRQNYLVSAHCVFNPTGETKNPFSPVPLSWQENAKVLADNSGCTVVVTGARQVQEYYEVDCLLENKTRSNMLFRLYDPIFNGVETDQAWALQLTPGAKCAHTIVFELPETAGHMRWLELEAQIFNTDEWFGRVWVQEEFCMKVTDL